MNSTDRTMKPIRYFVSGLGESEAYPSIRSRVAKAGWEKVQIKVPDSYFLYFAQQSKGDPIKVKVMLADLYPAFPPVDPRDIVAPLLDREKGLVIFNVRRGHLVLAEFFKKHSHPSLTDEGLTCSCHPGRVQRFYPTSIPDYKLIEGE